MIKALLGALLLIAGGLQGPSVQWKPEVKQADGVWQLVLTGQIGDNYYIHPMADPYTGVTLEVEETDAVLRLGLPDGLTLLIQIPLGAAIYVAGSVLLKLDSFEYLLSTVKNLISRKAG